MTKSSPPLHGRFPISCCNLLSENVDLFFMPRRFVLMPFLFPDPSLITPEKRMTLLCSWLRMGISQSQKKKSSSAESQLLMATHWLLPTNTPFPETNPTCSSKSVHRGLSIPPQHKQFKLGNLKKVRPHSSSLRNFS